MTQDARFWRNVIAIAAAHLAVLTGLARWGDAVREKRPAEILWLEGGAAAALMPASAASPVPAPTEDRVPVTPTEEQPTAEPVDSTIHIATPTPTPKPIPAATPTPKSSPTATPKPSPRPKATPTPKPKPSPTPRKKELTPAATPRGSAPGASAQPATKPTATSDTPPAAAASTTGTGTSSSSGNSAGAGRASQFGSYASMLHDRFFSQWVQPTSVVHSGTRMSTLVKLRIERDGRVSGFTIIRSSGNVVVDESVAAVAKRVTHVEPLPAGLGGAFYEVNINFELKAEQ